MPIPALPTDLDVTISSFHMLCDRLSNIEISLDALTANAKREQMSRSGHLDHKLLGYPFPILREREVCTLRGNIEVYPDTVVITILYEPNNVTCICSGDKRDEKYFTATELEQIYERTDLDSHPTPEEVGIRTKKDCLCYEAIERQVLAELDPVFGEGHFIKDNEGEYIIVLGADDEKPLELDMHHFIQEAVKLFRLRHGDKTVVELVLQDICTMFLRLHQYFQEWCHETDHAKRNVLVGLAEIAHSHVSRYALSKPSCFSPYFQEYSILLSSTTV